MQSYNNPSNYRNIAAFGKDINPPCAGTNDPLTMCLASTSDHKFQNGSIGNLFGPRSERCQNYMAERCAKNYDGFCHYFFKENGANAAEWPNQQSWPGSTNRTWEAKFGLEKPMSSGANMLASAAERKYCTYQNCVPQCERFNPTDPDSPMITKYVNPYGASDNCFPICRVDPFTVDNDVLMDRMIQNPTTCSSTIINICNTSRREGTDLSGTKIGRVCEAYFKNMNQLQQMNRR